MDSKKYYFQGKKSSNKKGLNLIKKTKRGWNCKKNLKTILNKKIAIEIIGAKFDISKKGDEIAKKFKFYKLFKIKK